ncbi:L,D-transpeptidase [Streptomyces anthocyanicus]|nr:L,D-transpeptidase [Streptomyces coelicolor]GGL57552.1 L,D-transpeptidase [Streptomyces anthocyanicus]GHC20950.1 L,D-transpeptidase [Streptomyces anthocyanicus]
MPVPARLPSWAWVSGLTVGAIAAVTVLAVQADQGPQPTAAATKPKPSASADAHPTPKETAPAPVPEGSGTGRRVVYSVGEDRVWLVDASDATRRSFKVWPGTVDPDPGKYSVGTRRQDPTTGSDGVRIEQIMYFTQEDGVWVAFSNAVDGSSPPPPADGAKTGGIRLPKADGDALWDFGTSGTTVTVVA